VWQKRQVENIDSARTSDDNSGRKAAIADCAVRGAGTSEGPERSAHGNNNGRLVPDALLSKTGELKPFFDRSLACAGSLKPKPTSKPKKS
jgi:hypothetical protein